MSYADVADLADVSVSTVVRAVKAGRLVKVPGTNRIVRWSVEQWLTGGAHPDTGRREPRVRPPLT